MFRDRYSLLDGPVAILGEGGGSLDIQRCFSRATGKQYAAKRLSVSQLAAAPFLLENESVGLTTANCRKVPRVVKCVEVLGCPTGDAVLVLELVDGYNLSEFRGILTARGSIDVPQHELHVKEVAAQLLQTVFFLHEAADLCHLDISSSNVMLCTDLTNPWDSIRLLDFGFCQPCHPVWCGDAAYEIRDVYPQGTTPPYAAPEVLAALQMQLEGAHSMDNFINGPSADLYSAGMVLYEYLTGELPFSANDSSAAGTAPSHVQDKSVWECYQAYRQMQQSWIHACSLTKQYSPDDSLDEVIDGITAPVQHPLLDRVKQCSTHPRQAALFFQHILNPDPHIRVWALHSPWLKEVVNRMLEATGTGWESGFEADETWRDKLSFFKNRFSCYREPSVEEQLSRNQYPDRSSNTEKRRHAALDRKLCKLHDAAVAIQEGTAKPQTSIKAHCKKAWTKLKCAVPGNRKRDRMCTQPFAPTPIIVHQ